MIILPLTESASSAKTMTRFAFTLLLILFTAGCQTNVRSPQPPLLAHATQATSPVKQFWSRTARFLQPLMPDSGKQYVETEKYFAANRPHSDILPVQHTARSLYTPGSMLPPPHLTSQEKNPVATVETASQVLAKDSNTLRIQTGDSEALKRLLQEVAVVPPGERKVNDEKLAEFVSTFRKEVMASEFEDEYLALLRKRILPETAPIPNTALADSPRSANNPGKTREFPLVYDDDSDDDLIPLSVPKRTTQNRDEPAVAQHAVSMPAPNYPTLPQLPDTTPQAAPGVVQTGYQAPYVPPTAMTGYGAGDWQTPTRLAIEQIRYAIEHTPNGRTPSLEMRLRMLEMLLGNKAEAVKPMQSANKTINNFMGNQILGFADLLDDTTSDGQGKYVSAAFRFNDGLMELQNLCPVRLKNVVFVRDWFGYGKFLPHPTKEFYPGEEFCVYVEMENLTVNKTTDGFEVGAAISYEILDEDAKVVLKKDAGRPAERTLSRTRDHCLSIPGTIPTALAPGQYQLRISLTDLNDDSMQFAQEQIPFRVVPSSEERL